MSSSLILQGGFLVSVERITGSGDNYVGKVLET